MKSALRLFSIRSYFRVFLAAVLVLGGPLLAQNANPEQTLAAMEKCREQVISGLSFSEKMKMKAAMAAIQNKPVLVAANSAVSSASTPEAQIEARKALSIVKLDLITRQDTLLKPVVDKIRAAQASLLK